MTVGKPRKILNWFKDRVRAVGRFFGKHGSKILDTGSKIAQQIGDATQGTRFAKVGEIARKGSDFVHQNRDKFDRGIEFARKIGGDATPEGGGVGFGGPSMFRSPMIKLKENPRTGSIWNKYAYC